MVTKRNLAFAIHDLNSWGGQERSTFQIASRLSKRWPLDVHSFTLDGESAGAAMKFHRVRPNIRRPFVAKATLYFLSTLWPFWIKPRLFGSQGAKPLIHATGACSLLSDVVQVQFVQAAWKDELRKLEKVKWRGDASSSLDLYHRFVLEYDIVVEKQVYTPNKTYIAISRSVAHELEKYFGLKKNVHVVHHGVDTSLFCPASGKSLSERAALRAQYGIAPDEIAILFVGAFARKGLGKAIEAVAGLERSQRGKVKLVAVGEGNRAAYENEARKLGVLDRLVLVRHTRNVVPFYQASDMFVLPTLYEPFGLVILEAMSCGLPVVTSKIAGASELIVDGESGKLISDPLDSGEISRHISALVNDTPLRERVGRNARQVALNQSWDKVADRYAEILSPLLGEKSG